MSSSGKKTAFAFQAPHQRHRFTLVEVLLAVTVLAVGLVGVLAAYAKSADALRIAKENVDAYYLLEQKVVEARLQALEPGPVAYGVKRGRFKLPYSHFAWEVAVRTGPDESEDIAELEATVLNQRNERSYSLLTYIRKPDIAAR